MKVPTIKYSFLAALLGFFVFFLGFTPYVAQAAPPVPCIASSFCTTWETTSPNESITIPTTGFAGYNYNVDWGDGQTSAAQSGDASHSYAVAGTYTVSITGTFPHILFQDSVSRLKIKTIEQWGTIHWTSMVAAFSGCSNLAGQAIDTPDLSGVTDMTYMFFDASSFNQNIDAWDVSHVTNMWAMFHGASSFNQSLNSWNVANVTNMYQMFEDATSFNGNIGSWNVGSVTNMSAMFHGASSFNQDLNSWNVASVTNMYQMFEDATFFNGNIANWNVGSVTTTSNMFDGASSFNQSLNSWNVANVINMANMFTSASSFNGNIANWNVGSVTNMSAMFHGASSFNQNIGSWNVAKVTNMSGTFTNASSFNQNIGSWNVAKVTNFSSTFQNAISFNQNIGSWLVASSTNMTFMFSGASSFNQDISPWDVSHVTSMSLMFFNASSFNQDISPWDVSHVSDMSYMFDGASAFNQNIGSWNVSSLFDASGMFQNATVFNQDISGWSTSNVHFMGHMFDGASSFNQNIGGWNVGNVTDMTFMFYGASAFNQNIGGWNVTNVADMTNLLTGATLSTTNYDALLVGWDSLGSLQSFVTFDGGNSTYCSPAAVSARDDLAATWSWTITDGGLCSSDATLQNTSKIKGTILATLGTPDAILANVTVSGTVEITSIQAQDTSNGLPYITSFFPTDAGATISKVVKYATGADITNFATDAAYANEAITDQDFFVVKVTAADSTVLYYKITVTVNAVDNPTPTITSISSNSALVGASAFTMSVTGTGFIPESVLTWNGSDRVTTYVSSTELTAAILLSDLTTAGIKTLTVTNPAPGGGSSDDVFFTVQNPAPTITSISSNSALVGASAFTMSVTGTNFIASSVLRWNGSDRVTTYVSPTELTASILLSDLSSVGVNSIAIFNPLPGGGTSTASVFTVLNPAPTLTSISKNSAVAGASAFTMSVTGTNFIASSVLRWNGSDRVTTYVSPTELTASILLSDLTTAGARNVTIYNALPGGGSTEPLVFTIQAAPVIPSSDGGKGGIGSSGSSGYIPIEVHYQTSVAAPSAVTVPFYGLVKLPNDNNSNTQEDTTVYYVAKDNRRHAFPNSKVYFSWFSDFSQVTIINAAQLASIPLGSNVTYKPGVKMVKFTTDSKVYAVDAHRTLRWVQSEVIAQSLYGASWNKMIDDIEDTFYTDYTFGVSVQGLAGFDPVKIEASGQILDNNL